MSNALLPSALVALATTLPAQALSGVEVGRPAPPLSITELLQAPDGQAVGWDAFEGKLVVLEFWATWCKPCVAAFPHLNELVEHFADADDVVFLSITDEQPAVVEPFLAKHPLASWIGIDGKRETARAYRINAIPRTIVVDKQGNVAADTYPTLLAVEAIEALRRGAAPDATQAPLASGSDGRPTGLDLLNLQRANTAPGPAHRRLEPLVGAYLLQETLGPDQPGLATPSLRGSARGRALAGGRYYAVEISYADLPGESSHFVFGYDRQRDAYVLHEYSLAAPAPLIWTGSVHADGASLDFERGQEIRLGRGDDAPRFEASTRLAIRWGVDGAMTWSRSLDFSAAGEALPPGLPAGEQSAGVLTFTARNDDE